MFALVKEKHSEADTVNEDITKVNERPVFNIESKSLKIIRRNG